MSTTACKCDEPLGRSAPVRPTSAFHRRAAVGNRKPTKSLAKVLEWL